MAAAPSALPVLAAPPRKLTQLGLSHAHARCLAVALGND
jgi:hypothetical protein